MGNLTVGFQEGADALLLSSDRFGMLRRDLDGLGTPPADLAEAVRLTGRALERFEEAALKSSRGARQANVGMISEATGLLQEGSAFIVAATEEIQAVASSGTCR